MSSNNRTILWVVALAIVVGFIYRRIEMTSEKAVSTSTPSTSAELIVGSVLPLTGDATAYGLPIQKAGALAAEQINAAGGIAGKPLKIAWEDGKCEGKEAASSARFAVTWFAGIATPTRLDCINHVGLNGRVLTGRVGISGGDWRRRGRA